MEFNALPLEVQFEIFTYLTPFELQHYVAPTSARWYEIASLPYFWRELSFNGTTHSSTQISETFQRSPLARQLQFCNVLNFSWTRDLVPFTSVTDVEFNRCSLNDSIMTEFSRIFPNIRKINITFYNCTNDFNVVYQIASLQSVESINLRPLQNIDGNKFLEFFSRNCNNLKHLLLGWFANITDRSLTTFLKSKGENLHSLALTGLERLTDISYQAIVECPYLDTLGLSRIPNMTDHQLASIQNLEHLRSLALNGGGKLFSRQFATIFKRVTFVHLEHVSIADCRNLSNSTLRILIESCPSLKSLNLYKLDNLTSDDFELIASVSRCLEKLHLEYIDNITESCVRNLADQLPSIKSIRAQNCFQIMNGEVFTITPPRRTAANQL